MSDDSDFTASAALKEYRVAAWPKRSLIGLVRAYRVALSPWLGNRCRFEPSCSAYALKALQRHGAAAGTWLSVRRVCRCHPFGPAGYDPVPERLSMAAPAGLRSFGRFVRRAARRRPASPLPSNDKKSS